MGVMPEEIRIVLINTSHPGNIGAVARAMKNMCLDQLVLVQPNRFPSAEATARASGADDLLEQARVCSSLDEAIQGSRLVIGASARLRSVDWPQLTPAACAAKVKSAVGMGPVSLLFGRENSGLTNDELGRCQYLVNIPSNPDYSSLNIAMAVQVICYELLVVASQGQPDKTPRAVATADQLQGLFDHLQQTMVDVGFSDPRQSERLMLRLRRLFLRAEPEEDDINILRGILTASQGKKYRFDRSRSDQNDSFG